MTPRIVKQIIFWVLLWTLVYQTNKGPDFSVEFIKRMAFLVPGVVLVVWVNSIYLLPRFYFSRQYLWYGIAGALMVGSMSRLVMFVYPVTYQDTGMARTGFLAVPWAVSLIGNALYEVSLFVKEKEQEAKNLQAEKLEAEMKFLKSQINPHFLFNALNNIYTQTLLKSDDASGNLLKLSAMLRYVLYDCSVDFVPLRKELDYIRNYIDLFRLKDSAGIDIQVNLDDSRPNRMVAPLLFIPLIENAFKHSGIERIGKGWVRVSLENTPTTLIFTVKNSLADQKQQKDKTGGIGLLNVSRQLELIYPGRHFWQVLESADTFEVQLKLTQLYD